MMAARISFMANDWLAILSQALPFNIVASWWAYGEARYGERKAIVEAEDWEGPSFQACVNAANVCRKFETKRRRLVLSFNHHREVCCLPPAGADALLDWCEETIAETGKPRLTRELRGEVHRWRVKHLEAANEAGGTHGCQNVARPPQLW
jgi:hypothetical protein